MSDREMPEQQTQLAALRARPTHTTLVQAQQASVVRRCQCERWAASPTVLMTAQPAHRDAGFVL